MHTPAPGSTHGRPARAPCALSSLAEGVPLSSHRLPHFSLRPQHGPRAASGGGKWLQVQTWEPSLRSALGEARSAGCPERRFSGTSDPTPGLSCGAEPGQWAHEVEEQGNGLLFTPPETGAGKSGAGAGVREGCSAPRGTYLAGAEEVRRGEEGTQLAGGGQDLSWGERATSKLV